MNHASGRYYMGVLGGCMLCIITTGSLTPSLSLRKKAFFFVWGSESVPPPGLLCICSPISRFIKNLKESPQS